MRGPETFTPSKSNPQSSLAEGAAIALASGVLPVATHLLYSDIKRAADKKKGLIKSGFIGTKDNDDGTTDTWFIKEAPQTHKKIAEKLASEILRYFIGEQAAEVKLIIQRNKIGVASKEIKSSKDLDDLYKSNPELFTQYGKADEPAERNNIAVKHFPGINDAIAASAFVGNPDLINGNFLAVVRDGKIEIVASADFDRAMLFYCSHIDDITLPNATLPANAHIIQGEPYTVTDCLRTMHAWDLNNEMSKTQNDSCKIDRSLLINKDFAAAVDRIINKYDNNFDELNNLAKETTLSIIKSYKAANYKNTFLLPCVGKDVNIGNLPNKIIPLLQERLQQMKDLSLSIKVQLAIREGKLDTIQSIADAAGYTPEKKLTFLPENASAESLTPPMTITEYINYSKHQIKQPNIGVFTTLVNEKHNKETVPTIT